MMMCEKDEKMTGTGWIAVMCRGADENVERFATRQEAEDRVITDWQHLTRSERRGARDYVGRITEAYDECGDVQEIVLDTDATMDLYLSVGDDVYRVAIPEMDDVWRAVKVYDELNGTDLWDHLDEDSVLGVNLPEYGEAVRIGSWDDVGSREAE